MLFALNIPLASIGMAVQASWPWQKVEVLGELGICFVGLGPFGDRWKGQDLASGHLCYGSCAGVALYKI